MRKILLVLALFSFSYQISSQAYYGADANKLVHGSEILRLSDNSTIPSFIKFKKNYEIDVKDLNKYLHKVFKIPNEYGISLIDESIDNLGITICRYQQTYKNYAIFNAVFLTHSTSNKIFSISGNLLNNLKIETQVSISESQALEIALASIVAERYKWEMPEEEQLLKQIFDDNLATYYPNAEMIIFPEDLRNNNAAQKLTYKFNIYADKPLKKANIYVDASTGKIIFTEDKIHIADVTGTAVTKYSGNQTITSDSNNGHYRLRESGRGNGIETYNMNTGTSYGAATDFWDNDNYWNNANPQIDEVATDAHWASEMTYDYYLNYHNRNSIDDNGFALMSYVHYDVAYDNAFWDGMRMTYGDGSGTPYCALDVVGHEITHGLTSYTANLVYAYEPGAINEGFSDIFGTCIEFYGKPQSANWTMGEDLGFIMRSMSNPNLYGNPDTYHGDYWYYGSDDNGGVHYNSSVLNHWFYLIAMGGSGTNDIGNSFSIQGIGIDSAAAVAFRTLTVYLTNTSDYEDTRFYAILAAIDLFGPCSSAVEAVTRAWYAVGIGNDYTNTVVSDFSSDFTEFCMAPAEVQFLNNSINGMSFFWDFGDGSNSTEVNPTHSYNVVGEYTVSLSVDGGSCGDDTLILTNLISIDPANPCIFVLSESGNNTTQTSCFGTMFDSGGQSNYQDNTNTAVTIEITDAVNVTLNFASFNFEQDYDYLYIFDGPTVNSPLIGIFTGTALPNGGTVVSSGNSVTIQQTSDQYLTESGFELTWSCDMLNSAPYADFFASEISSCTGEIHFTDLSNSFPTNWFWNFGDGETSTLQNPVHQYTQNGIFSITLICSNSYGSDSLTYSDFVSIEMPSQPITFSQESCSATSFLLHASGTGELRWYDSLVNGNLVNVGDTFITPLLLQNTNYFVEDFIEAPSLYVGKADNSGGGGNFSAPAAHYLVFDCYSPVTLSSVKVYADGTGYRTIELHDNTGSVLQSIDVQVFSGESRIDLNFEIPVGESLRLVGPESPNLYRNNAGVSYPYNLAGLIDIKFSSASSAPTDYYYFFYDWEVIEVDCKSAREIVSATIIEQAIANFNFTQNQAIVDFQNLSANATSYYWDFGNGIFSVEENPTHIFTIDGTYEVKLISSNNCGDDTLSQTVIIQGLVSNSITNVNSIEIFPNPAYEVLNISFTSNQQQIIAIKIIDVIGKTLWSEELRNHKGLYKKTIDLNNISSGIYIISISNENRVHRKKIIIEPTSN